MQKLNLRMQKLNLRIQKLNFPGTHWRGMALIGAQKNSCYLLFCNSNHFRHNYGSTSQVF